MDFSSTKTENSGKSECLMIIKEFQQPAQRSWPQPLQGSTLRAEVSIKQRRASVCRGISHLPN